MSKNNQEKVELNLSIMTIIRKTLTPDIVEIAQGAIIQDEIENFHIKK